MIILAHAAAAGAGASKVKPRVNFADEHNEMQLGDALDSEPDGHGLIAGDTVKAG